MKIHPKEDCKQCSGTGLVSGDWVDYGSTQTQLPEEYCDCVLEQLPEDYSGEIEIESPVVYYVINGQSCTSS